MDSEMQNVALSRATRWGMVVTGIVQGLLCHLFVNWLGPVNNDWLVYGMPFSLAVSSILLMTVVSFKQRALWGWLAVVAVVVLAMSGWLKWNLTDLSKWNVQGALIIFGLALILMTLLALPWLQLRLNPPKGARYAQFYARMWQNALNLLVILVVNGLVWLVLLLWSELFRLVGIDFFRTLFFKTDGFVYPLTGAITALAVILARTQLRLIAAVQKLLTFIAIGLLPMVSVLALLFIVTLPFTGLNSISRHVSSAGLLSSLALLLLLLMAIVRDPQREWLPYPQALRCLVKVSLLITPVYVLIAGWALALRIQQYGWTAGRLCGVLVVGVLLVWSLGYLVSIIRRKTNPIHLQGKVNQAVSAIACLLLILLHTPVLDPARISVNSHMARYHSGKITADEVSLYMLDNSLKPGREALLALQKDAAFIKDAKRKQALNSILNGDRGWQDLTSTQLAKNIALVPGTTPPEASFWQKIAKDTYNLKSCREPASCLLANLDLNGDGQPERVIFAFGDGEMLVYRNQNAEWKNSGRATLPAGMSKENVLKAAADGKLNAKPKVWQNVAIEGDALDIYYYNN